MWQIYRKMLIPILEFLKNVPVLRNFSLSEFQENQTVENSEISEAKCSKFVGKFLYQFWSFLRMCRCWGIFHFSGFQENKTVENSEKSVAK